MKILTNSEKYKIIKGDGEYIDFETLKINKLDYLVEKRTMESNLEKGRKVFRKLEEELKTRNLSVNQFELLPPEIMKDILNNLDDESLYNMCNTSTKILDICESDPDLFRGLGLIVEKKDNKYEIEISGEYVDRLPNILYTYNDPISLTIYKTSLEKIVLDNLKLDDISIHENKKLKYISISNTSDESVNIGISDNDNLETIKIKNCNTAYWTEIYGEKIKTINIISVNKDVENSKLEELSLESTPQLENLFIENSKFKGVYMDPSFKSRNIHIKNCFIKNYNNRYRNVVKFIFQLETLE